MRRIYRSDVTKTSVLSAKHAPGNKGRDLDPRRPFRQLRSLDPKVEQKKTTTVRPNEPAKSLSGGTRGTTYFNQDDCTDVALKELQAVLTSRCSVLDDRLIKATFPLRRFSQIDDHKNDIGARAHEKYIEGLFQTDIPYTFPDSETRGFLQSRYLSETEEIGLFQKRNYRVHCEARLYGPETTLFNAVMDISAGPNLVR